MLDRYYQDEYQKKQFPYENSVKCPPDMRIVDGVIPRGKKVLSIGCNTGRDISFLTKENYVVGLDLMPDAIKEAISNGLDSKVWNVENGLPFPNKEFDIIVCKEVLEHLIDPLFVMNEIHRVLKDDGYAFITVPNHFWYFFRLRILFGKGLLEHDFAHVWNEWNYFHIRFFTFKGFNQLIKQTSFDGVRFYFPQTLAEIFAPAKLTRLNFLVPKRICTLLCKWRPNLLCTRFCVRVVKK